MNDLLMNDKRFCDTYAFPVHPKECAQGHVRHRLNAHPVALAPAQLVPLSVHPMESL